MNSNLKSTQIGGGVSFNSVIDSRFKTNRISINFITELHKDTATSNAILPFILKKGYSDCADFTAFNRKLQELYGASVDGYVSKIGDYQTISLAVVCIDDRFSLDNDTIIDKAAEILCGMALKPVLVDGCFCSEDVELEKVTLIDTIESEINEKRTYAINRLVKLMCPDEPFGIPKYGFKDDAKALTPKSVKTAYDKLVSTSKIEIMYVGCSGDDKALNVFSEIFKSVKRDYTPLKPITTHPQSTDKEQTEQLAVNQSKMVLGFANGLSGTDPMVAATKMMVAVLGGTVTSKLFVNVREKLSLCYYCAARYDRFKGIMLIDSGVESENIDMAKIEIIKQLQAIKDGDVTDEELKHARLSLVNSLNTVYDSDSAIEAWFLGQILSGTTITPMQEATKFESIAKSEIVDAATRFVLDSAYILTGSIGNGGSSL